MRPCPGGGVHQASPLHGDTHRIAKAEYAGGMRRGDLPDAVSEHDGRAHAPTAPQLGQRDLHREDRGLRIFGPVQQRVGFAGFQHVLERPAGLSANQRIAAIDRGRQKPARSGSMPAPIRGHCDPCPENTNATGPGLREARPRDTV